MKKVIFLTILIVMSFALTSGQASTKVEACEDRPVIVPALEVLKVMRIPSSFTKEEQKVDVEVTTDKKGRVISAHALSGPLPLQDEAALSAMKLRFPSHKNGKGKITYIFVPFFDPKTLVLPRAVIRSGFLFIFYKFFDLLSYLLFHSRERLFLFLTRRIF